MNMICGVFERSGARPEGLGGMLEALPGLGGDATATWAEGPVALGWRGEAQGIGAGSVRPADETAPIERDACLAVVATARIDGRAALCDALGLPRSERGSLSDAALVLRAFRRWGSGCPSRLLGDYAFAGWDAERRELLLARDHAGARPLYYSLSAQRVVFASDVNAVLAAPGVPQSLDEAATASWLDRNFWRFGERTFHSAVRRLLPGHLLAVGGGRVRVERWWRPEDAPPVPVVTDDAIAEAVRTLMEEAVEDRLRGPNPVGVHLSGGLDSSGVAALAARALRRAGRPPPPAFSWHPPPAGPDDGAEHRLITVAAESAGLRVHYCPPAPDDITDALRQDATRHFTVAENERPVRRAAAERGVRALLSGTGGDEGVSFNGRGYLVDLLRELQIGALWREAKARGRHPLARVALEAALPLAWPQAAMHAQNARLRLARGEWPIKRPRPSFLHPSVARRAGLLPTQPQPVGMRGQQLGLMEFGAVGTRIDAWAASGARLGIEYRYPLLDRRLLEFVLGLPPDQFRRGNESRGLMRRALADALPGPVRRQAKDPDPIRFMAYTDSFRAALVQVRGTLAARDARGLERAAYLDMASLSRHLDAAPGDYRGRLRLGALTRALSFLDWCGESHDAGAQ